MSYLSEQLADQPLGCWPLDERSGASAVDVVLGNNGTYAATGVVLQDRALLSDGTKSPLFDGTIGEVAVPDHASYNLTGSAVSIECLFWLTGLPVAAANRRFFHRANAYQFMANEPDGNLRFLVRIAAVSQILVVGANLKTGRLYHAVAVYDGANQIIYLDGIEVGRRAQTGTLDSSVVTPWIGGNGVGDRHPGNLGGVAIYGTALTPERVAAHYMGVKSYSERGVV